jgi:hypothetical protein
MNCEELLDIFPLIHLTIKNKKKKEEMARLGGIAAKQ